MSGRIADIVIDPDLTSTWYVAVGSGGVWKTENAGTTWKPIFDDQPSYSIGALALDPNDSKIVWVGTGENVGGRHVGYGDGVYRSPDGGATWERMGLENSEHIGMVLVDPRDSNTVYVAAEGPLWTPGGDRGLFKTTDGGKSWEKVLGGGPYTGVASVVMDPRNPDVLYAATWQHHRTVAALVDGGPESGIHKTTDGGATWRELTKGLPNDPNNGAEEMGLIGLAISPQNPEVIYATIELAWRKGGFYRSEDGGTSWEKRNDYLSGGTGPHYYQEIFACPHKFDRVYQMDVRIHHTDDGGRTFQRMTEVGKHSDNHAMAFRADLPDYLLVGTDGGIYETWDRGKNWKFVANLPVTQFYKLALDNAEPFYNIYGGTQDNNSQGGPSRTDSVQGIRNSDWFVTLGGDGHGQAADPTDPNIIYSESQQGVLNRHDRATGENILIQPQPGKGDPAERWNWDSPILISPHDPARLYFASQRIWRSDDRGDSWRPISGDLSRGLDRFLMPMMGRVQSVDAVWDLWAMSAFSNVTSLSESPLVEGLIYAGTDDGLIQVTEDGGASWRRIDGLPGVPKMAFVNDIKADLHDPGTVYVALDNHKESDYAPYLLKSTDRGKSWTSIAGTLPDRHLVWRIVQDHVNPSLLFAGTEFGVFFTVDGGSNWVKLSGKAPNISFRDLMIQKRENDLVGATFGRSFWILDDYTSLRQVSNEMLQREATLFPVRDAWWYVPRRTLGNRIKASQGAAYVTAPNPPFGAVFTYYLRDDIKSAKEMRRDREKEIAAEGGDTPYPGWDVVLQQEQEEPPAIVLTIHDGNGELVRRISGPAKAGFHRVAWDLRYPLTEAITTRKETEERWFEPAGPLAAPGSYTVTMHLRAGGELTQVCEPQAFTVKPLRKGTLPGSSSEEAVAFARELAETQRQASAVKETLADSGDRLRLIKEALMKAAGIEPALDAEARALERRLLDLRNRFHGNAMMNKVGEPIPHTIGNRLRAASSGTRHSTYGPTPNLRKTLTIAQEELAELKAGLRQLVEVDIPAFEAKLEAAGVPWTSGRMLPGD
jgi:photosystem II stability/assembly factor-like uncharacterized protein